MKSLKLFFLFSITFFFTGCLEINEEIQINKNGSGNLAMKTDMGKLFEMLEAFMPADELKKSEFSASKDTIIRMKDILDTLQSMTPDKKAVLRDGTIHLQMNMAEKKFNINMNFPFQKTADIGKIYANLGEAQSGMGQMMKGMGGGEDSGMSLKAPDGNSNTSFYDLNAEKGSLTRTLNKEKYDLAVKEGKMEQLKQMGSMGADMDIKMNTTIKLPSPAKKLTGAKAELSTDKKTVLIKASMADMYEHPELYEFSVKY
jgi:hypothetical protein